MNPVNLYIVDDYLLTRIAYKRYFEKDSEFKITGDFSSAEECIKNMEESPADVILMDIELPDINGIEATKIIKEKYPKTKVIILTSFQSKDRVVASIACGASGYILKHGRKEEIKQTIKAVLKGEILLNSEIAQMIFSSVPEPDYHNLDNLYADNKLKNNLTKREKEVLKLLVEGKTNLQIAQEMVVSVNTAKAHVGKILTKLSAQDRVQAAVKAVRAKIF